MTTRAVKQYASHLPVDDDHPFRTGPWRPNTVEYSADELEVIIYTAGASTW
ncbi:MAG: hypothetical protein KC912_14160 [Proteobacteria bacterium]|nr:hypothetical protein [Pseudomonadota bacterium]